MLKAGLASQTEGPGGVGAQGTKIIQPPLTPAEIAALFPQLEILECLGRGGMGVVYKARQPRLNRIVALKILAQEKDQDGQFVERFTREAQALARLNHPNIVTVHDFGEAGGHCYLVMEFVDGLNLRQLLLAGKMPPDQALTIVPMICEALQYAHEQGVVHRDIKPENILLEKSGRVKIADFGIAKMMGVGDGQQALTGAKDVVGTPHYMAPEQLEKPLTVDHRADIYSLGVVFYEMLTGELPLGKFAPPSKKVQIDVRLDEVVLHTLEKEPARRYQQANQLKTDVETISGTASTGAGFAAKGGAVPLPATASAKATSDKAMLPAFLMAFFFGVFGAHRFYVGKIRIASLQLGALGWCILLIIACAIGVTGRTATGILLGFSVLGIIVWAAIDCILILCKAFTDGQGRRITNWLHPQAGELNTAVSPPANPPSPPPPGGAAPPAAGPQPAPMAHEKTPVNGTGKIVAPAVGLMVCALWKLLSALTALFFVSGYSRWLEPMLGNFGIGSFSSMADVGIVLFKVVPGLLILFGAFQMLRLRSYAWAVAAAILSIVACSLIGLPMGIWALIILLQPDVRETFGRATVSSPSRTGPWPWLLAAVAGVIVIGLFCTVVLVYEVAPETSLFGRKPGVTTRMDDASDSTTGEMAMPVSPVALENAAPVPGSPPVRIKAGSSRPLTDSEGNLWLADQGFTDGETTERSDHLAIANTEDPALYQNERYGMTSFAYPVPNGKYVVKLHFAETYDAIKGPGGRVFTFIVEGHEFKDFDVWARAGGAQRACVESVTVEVTDGKLNIYFIHQQENPEINGIEILPAPPAVPIQTDGNALIGPATHGDSSKTLNISSQNGQVVIETTNGRLTTDKVQLQTSPNGSLNLTASKVHYVVAPTPPTSPVAPAPPVPPIPASATMSSQPMTAGTRSEPHVQKTKILGNLLTKDEFQQDFSQTLPLAANGRLSLDNVNGRIEIAGWDRHEVAIKALKHGKTRESVEAAKIIINSRPDEILIHTEQPSSVTGFPWSWPWFKNSKRNDGIVDYAIQVPQNARLKNISSINGHIVIEDVSGDIEASTVNGETQISGAAGNLKLSTVNGRIEAQLASLGNGQSVSLDAVNGQLEAILPSNADANVSASTLNGGISSEFASLVVKKEFPVGSNLKGKLGNGGARVKASTVNGGIRFRRGQDTQ
jgi:tRNA A-37 threonylcarbamoyl transferase component Bud32/TM2 domain-containing membrane protein YozV